MAALASFVWNWSSCRFQACRSCQILFHTSCFPEWPPTLSSAFLFGVVHATQGCQGKPSCDKKHMMLVVLSVTSSRTSCLLKSELGVFFYSADIYILWDNFRHTTVYAEHICNTATVILWWHSILGSHWLRVRHFNETRSYKYSFLECSVHFINQLIAGEFRKHYWYKGISKIFVGGLFLAVDW